jgi:hypothetical protein
MEDHIVDTIPLLTKTLSKILCAYTILFYYFYAIYEILINVNHYGFLYGITCFMFLDIFGFIIYILT